MENQTIYQQKGHANRMDYLRALAEDNGVEVEDVAAIASMLGESEDFDGLVTAVEDLAGISDDWDGLEEEEDEY